jgi:hypothetical protein
MQSRMGAPIMSSLVFKPRFKEERLYDSLSWTAAAALAFECPHLPSYLLPLSAVSFVTRSWQKGPGKSLQAAVSGGVIRLALRAEIEGRARIFQARSGRTLMKSKSSRMTEGRDEDSNGNSIHSSLLNFSISMCADQRFLATTIR